MADMAKIKEVRERTGVGFGDCKKALEKADWDIEKALDVLRKESAVKAAKKADRTASEGRLAVLISDDQKRGAIAEINTETDFAARNERFVKFCDRVIEVAIEQGDATIPLLEDEKNELVSAIGENISIRRVATLQTDQGVIAGYLHSNGVVGAIVELSKDVGPINKNIAMHVTADSPLVVSSDELPEQVIARETEVYKAQALEMGKPEHIVEGIVKGKLRKFQSESCLDQQAYIWDRDQTVGALLAKEGATCERFVRYQVGESLE